MSSDLGLAFGQTDRGGYVGWVTSADLGPLQQATHQVAVRSTLGFAGPDIKTPDPLRLSLGAKVACVATDGMFAVTAGARPLYIPANHLVPVGDLAPDTVSVAETLLGTPYLWGGNSADGLDCSGLVQVALLACGIDCPGDSDLQREAFEPVDAAQRGDLIFWHGHVAMVRDAQTVIHANGHHMAVALEDQAACIARIKASENKDVLKITRPAQVKVQ